MRRYTCTKKQIFGEWQCTTVRTWLRPETATMSSLNPILTDLSSDVTAERYLRDVFMCVLVC